MNGAIVICRGSSIRFWRSLRRVALGAILLGTSVSLSYGFGNQPEPSRPATVTVGPALEGRSISRIVVSLADQAFAAYAGPELLFKGPISSGMEGFTTRTGNYKVTSKHKDHVSTIYDVRMPYFLRFDGSALGMHEGILPGWPASHGCIRTKMEDAQRLFGAARIGTRVDVITESTPDTFGVPQPPPIIKYFRMVKGKKVFLSDEEAEAYKSSSATRSISTGNARKH